MSRGLKTELMGRMKELKSRMREDSKLKKKVIDLMNPHYKYIRSIGSIREFLEEIKSSNYMKKPIFRDWCELKDSVMFGSHEFSYRDKKGRRFMTD